jgi:single-stranded DNA-binding protein
VVAGELRQTSWDDEKGGKHSRTEVSVTNVEFQSRSRNERQPVAPAPQQAAPQQPQQQALYDEDISF